MPPAPIPDVAAAIAAAKKEKRAAAAAEAAVAMAMAPRMQSQVQKWNKMTAELGGKQFEMVEAAVDASGKKPKKMTSSKKIKKPAAAPLRAPHRRDRLLSFGVGGTDATTPPVCLLCRARFASPQQLRDHEVLSQGHRRRLRDRAARKAAAAAAAGFPRQATRRLPRRSADPAPVYTSYAAPTKTDATTTHCCLLCRRRFRRRAALRLHERESALHRQRLRDPAAVAAAVAAVDAAADATQMIRPLLRMRPATAAYRDRARERRQAFGRQEAVTATTTTTTTPAPTSTPTATPSGPTLGAALLGKMGWAAGQGLGADGSGPTAALAPAAYRAGVGLGADGGRLGDAAAVAARRTEAGSGSNSYSAFVAQAQESARQRFQALAEQEAQAKNETKTDTKTDDAH